MPVESGPTKLLPFSSSSARATWPSPRGFPRAFRGAPSSCRSQKGDAVFFNPALFHAGARTGRRTSSGWRTSCRSPRPWGARWRRSTARACAGGSTRPFARCARPGGSTTARPRPPSLPAAEGYAFPTNLDTDPPAGGLAPETQAALCGGRSPPTCPPRISSGSSTRRPGVAGPEETDHERPSAQTRRHERPCPPHHARDRAFGQWHRTGPTWASTSTGSRRARRRRATPATARRSSSWSRGKARVAAAGQDFGEMGDRMDVFEKTPPHCLYVPNGKAACRGDDRLHAGGLQRAGAGRASGADHRPGRQSPWKSAARAPTGGLSTTSRWRTGTWRTACS
jgi:hypothetical protein